MRHEVLAELRRILKSKAAVGSWRVQPAAPTGDPHYPMLVNDERRIALVGMSEVEADICALALNVVNDHIDRTFIVRGDA